MSFDYCFACPDLHSLSQWLDIHAWTVLEPHLPQLLLQQLLQDEAFELGLRLGIQPDTPPQQAALLQQIQQLQQTQLTEYLWIAYPWLRIQSPDTQQWHLLPAVAWRVQLLPAADQPHNYLIRYERGDWRVNTLFTQQDGYTEIAPDMPFAAIFQTWSAQLGIDALPDRALQPLPSHGTTDYHPAWLPALLLLPINAQTCTQAITEQPIAANNTADTPAPPDVTPTTEQMPAAVEQPQSPPAPAVSSLALGRKGRQWKTALSALPLWSEQQHAAQTLYQGKSLVVEGAQKTGKTHWLASVLPAIWADGGTALLVLPQGTTPSDLLYHLEQMGLKDIGILSLLEEDSLEKERLLAFLDKLPQLTKNAVNPDQEVSYKKQGHSYQRYRRELDAVAQHLQTEITDGVFWSDMVGRFLLYHKTTGKYLLQRALQEVDFLFSEAEYMAISEELAIHQPLFEPLQTMEHPLGLLHEAVFAQDKKAALQQVQFFVETNRNRGYQLLNRYLALIDEYAQSLQSGYDEHADRLRRQAESVLYTLELYLDIYGDGLERSGAVLRVMGIFSGHHRDVRSAKDVLFQAYQKLEEEHLKYKYFEAKLPNIRMTPLKEVADKLRLFLQELERWQLRTPRWVEQKIQEWTTQLPIKIEFRRQLEDTDRQLQDWLQEIRSATVFRRAFDLRETTVLHRTDLLREILAYIAETQRLLPDFLKFYTWRGHWLGLSQRTQQVVQALVSTQTQDWQSAFGAWYIHQWLSRSAGAYHSERNLPLKEYVDNAKTLRTSVAQHALGEQRQIQQQLLAQWKKEGKQWRTNYQAKSLLDLLQGIGLQGLRMAFPLVIATPEWAKRLADLHNTPWDLVAVESAHLLDTAAVTMLLGAGNQVCILGLPLEETPAARLSLMAQALRQTDYYRKHTFSRLYSKDAKATQYPSQIPIKSTFRQAVCQYLAGYLDIQRIEENVPCEGVLADIVIKPIFKNAAPIAVLCDGWCKPPTWSDYEWAYHQRQTLEGKGYVVTYAWSDEWWRSPEKAAQSLVAFVVHWDRQYLPRQ